MNCLEVLRRIEAEKNRKRLRERYEYPIVEQLLALELEIERIFRSSSLADSSAEQNGSPQFERSMMAASIPSATRQIAIDMPLIAPDEAG
jgi:hypothetical protein